MHRDATESLATMPTDVNKVYDALLAEKRKNKPTSKTNNNKKRKADKAKKTKNKIKQYAKLEGYETLKIPTNKQQQDFIYGLIKANKDLRTKTQSLRDKFVDQQADIEKYKKDNDKYKSQIDKLKADNEAIEKEKNNMFSQQREFEKLLIQKDETISELVIACKKELRSQQNHNGTETERHLNELIVQ